MVEMVEMVEMAENEDDPFAAPADDVGAAAPVTTEQPIEAAIVDAATPAPEAPEPIAPDNAAPPEEAGMTETNDVFGGLVPMMHPDGGSCDAFEEVGGRIMVPAEMVDAMRSHGFSVA